MYAGDLLFSSVGSANLTSNNLVALDAGFSTSLALAGADLAVFRPDTAGDYSRGQFGLLIEDLPGATVLSGVTLIEQTTVVGGYTLEAGDFLYARNGGSQDHSVWVYETDTIGSGSAPDQRREFLKGDDAGVSIANPIVGLEFIAEPTRVGNVLLDTGTLLLTIDGSETVGNNNLAVDVHDVFALDIGTSSLVGSGVANGTMLFDGSDVAFDSLAEEINALTLFKTAAAAGPNMDPVAEAGSDQTIAEGESLTVDGSGSSDADGSIVQYAWDLNNDGSFEETGVTPTIAWSTLVGANIDDDGSYVVALRVTDDDGAQHTDTFNLTVTNTAPTFTVTADSSVEVGTLFSLDISASDPGDDLISGYFINWGDGTITNPAYTGATTTVTHTYTDAGFIRGITFYAVDEDGTFTDSDLIVGTFSGGDDAVFRFDGTTGNADGQFGSSGGDLNRAYAPLFMANGDYLVAGYDSNNITRYDADGNYLGVFVASSDLDPGPANVELDKPADLAWGPDGNLYVANYNDDQILRFDAAGNFIDVFGTDGGIMNGPSSLAWSPDGDLYVASYDNDKIVRFDGNDGGNAFLVIPPDRIDPGAGRRSLYLELRQRHRAALRRRDPDRVRGRRAGRTRTARTLAVFAGTPGDDNRGSRSGVCRVGSFRS